jgi:phytoene dehydrogenase-like protein
VTLDGVSSIPREVDAVVIGAGPNGLVAANALADAGWDVVVLEAQDTVGGAVRSAEFVRPGYVSDQFSAFYPLAAASPVMRDLDLHRHGLRWVHAPDVLAHPLDDGRCAVLSRSLERTAASLDSFAPGDGAAWADMFARWQRVRDPLLDALFTPLPPVRSMLSLLRRLGTAGALEMARFATLPVRRMAAESFAGEGAALMLTGNAMHADVIPDAAGSGIFGWLMSMLGQDVGFPAPQGGAQRLADALASRAIAGGGQIHTDTAVTEILLRGRRAVGVRTLDGGIVRARRAVLADVSAPDLYLKLVGVDHLPSRLVRDLERFELDWPTLKVNWALSTPVPWAASGAAGAGTVHLGVGTDGFVDFAADLSKGQLPQRPLVLFGQMTVVDPSRSPAGTESAWGYTHLPRDLALSRSAVRAQVERVEAAIERVAPGFGEAITARVVQSPRDLETDDANLTHGAINGGTSAIHQQAIFRPVPGTGRPQTPYDGLYLASASAHPGGGVHGACGWNAARAAMSDHGALGPLRRQLHRTVWSRLLSSQGPG